MYCSKCGKDLSKYPVVKFCPQCGKEIRAASVVKKAETKSERTPQRNFTQKPERQSRDFLSEAKILPENLKGKPGSFVSDRRESKNSSDEQAKEAAFAKISSGNKRIEANSFSASGKNPTCRFCGAEYSLGMEKCPGCGADLSYKVVDRQFNAIGIAISILMILSIFISYYRIPIYGNSIGFSLINESQWIPVVVISAIGALSACRRIALGEAASGILGIAYTIFLNIFFIGGSDPDSGYAQAVSSVFKNISLLGEGFYLLILTSIGMILCSLADYRPGMLQDLRKAATNRSNAGTAETAGAHNDTPRGSAITGHTCFDRLSNDLMLRIRSFFEAGSAVKKAVGAAAGILALFLLILLIRTVMPLFFKAVWHVLVFLSRHLVLTLLIAVIAAVIVNKSGLIREEEDDFSFEAAAPEQHNGNALGGILKFIGNIIWFIFGGLPSGLGWVLAGTLWCITIIGIPVGLQCFKLCGLSFWPFGKRVVYSGKTMMFLVNIIWCVLSGFWLALGNFLLGCVFCITIIGIPFGKQFFKIARLALAPFGASVVPA